eukprot:751488-Rhodomonas_salina.3
MPDPLFSVPRAIGTQDSRAETAGQNHSPQSSPQHDAPRVSSAEGARELCEVFLEWRCWCRFS